jgi:hypothetical protein
LNLFSSTFAHKSINIFVVLVGFVFFVLGGFIFIFLKILYRSNSIPILGNFKNLMHGASILIICPNFRNLVLGVFHIFVEGNYYYKVGLLSFAEVTFIILLFKSLSKKSKLSPFISKTVVWLQIIFPSLIRILLIVIFELTYIKYPDAEAIFNEAFMSIEIKLIYCYVVLYLLSIVRDSITTIF